MDDGTRRKRSRENTTEERRMMGRARKKTRKSCSEEPTRTTRQVAPNFEAVSTDCNHVQAHGRDDSWKLVKEKKL